MAKALSRIDGFKTYGLAIAFTAYAVFGWFFDLHSADTMMQIININGLGATLRHAVGKL